MLKKLVILPVRGYQRFIRPCLHALSGQENTCRFHPSCSNYFIEAVQVHGVLRGSLMGIWRILRCNPWGGYGYDPVPPRKK
ncbi:MAG: membrane protein insertion efficiency factor YidD [Akkermansia sp.]